MTCKNCKTKPVWKFTNQTQLCKTCFTDYLEGKVFRTIRKHSLLPKDKIIFLEKSDSLNTKVLRSILEKKFSVKTGKPNIGTENLSELAEKNMQNIIEGKFSKVETKSPLSEISDAELEVYAKIKQITGKPRTKDKKVQELFDKFMKKNPDLEINVIKAIDQL